MTLVRYEPYRLMNQLQQEINRMFESNAGQLDGDHSRLSTSDWVPAVDIHEEDEKFLIIADLPGVGIEDVDVTLDKGVLTISGKRSLERKESNDRFSRTERVSGVFHRRFSLPEIADPERVDANFKNGVLEITVAKREVAQPRRITVNINE